MANKRLPKSKRHAKVFGDAEVINSARPMRIEITDADIRKGDPLDPTSCAAAQAIMRATKATEVKVHRGMTYLKLGKNWVRFKTTTALRLETIVFDRGGRFMPGEYDLNPAPVDVVRKAGKKLRPPPSATAGAKGTQARLRARRTTIPGVRKSVYQRGDD